MEPAYIELHLHSPYSFLDGGSDLETLLRSGGMAVPQGGMI